MNELPWDEAPIEAFQTYMRSTDFRKKRRRPAIFAIADDMPLRPATETMYGSMFRTFHRWITERDVKFRAVTADDILAFLDQQAEDSSSDPERGNVDYSARSVVQQKQRGSRIRARYLGLLRRVYDPIKKQSKNNPAEEAAARLFGSRAFGSDKPSCFLSEVEQEAFLAAIPPYELPTESEGPKAWKQRRDRALQLLMYGAGLTTAEIRGLYVENLRVVGAGVLWVDVMAAAGDGRGVDHSVQIESAWTSDILTWLDERREMNTGKILFPNDRVEKEKHDANKLTSSTIFRIVQKTFKHAGIDVDREGPRTLRNTFAVNLQRRGATPEELKDQLGLRSLRATEGYVRAFRDWEITHGADTNAEGGKQ